MHINVLHYIHPMSYLRHQLPVSRRLGVGAGDWRLCSGRCFAPRKAQPTMFPPPPANKSPCGITIVYRMFILYNCSFIPLAWDRLPPSANSDGYFGKFSAGDERSIQYCILCIVFPPDLTLQEKIGNYRSENVVGILAKL